MLKTFTGSRDIRIRKAFLSPSSSARKKKVHSFFLFLFALLCTSTTLLAQPAGWAHRKEIRVTNAEATAVTGYQLLLTLNTQELVAAGQLQPDGRDLRFGNDEAGSVLFPYYLESGMNTTATRVWVKIDAIPANATKSFYLYYGNASAAAASSLSIFSGPYSATNGVADGGPGGAGNSQRGFRFSPKEDILVTSFGKNEPNGTTRYITLFDFATEAIIKQTQVAGPAGTYSYAPLAENIWLNKDQQYVLQIYQGATDGYYFGTSNQINEHLVYYDMRYCNGCTENTFPTQTLGNYHYGYPDLQFYTRNSSIPQPAYAVGPFVTIAPATLANGQVGTAYSQSLTATGSVAPYTFSVASGALPTGLTLSAAGTLSGTPTATGNFTFTIAATDGSPAPAQTGTRAYTLSITPGNQTISFAALADKTYGDADFDPGATASSNLPVTYTSSNPDVATIVAGNIHIVGAGSVVITASQAGDANYATAPTASQTLTVHPKAVTVTADAQTKIYGEADPALTYTVAPALVSGDAFTGTLSRAAGEDVGTYAITQHTLALNANYVITYTSANFIITKKAVTVTANAGTKTYGDLDPALTYTVAPALVSGDVFSGALNRATGEVAGSYAIGQGTLTLSGNYDLTYISAPFTITPKAVTVTANALSKTYGDADPAFTYSVAPALVSGDAFTGALNRTAGENVGTYPIGQGTLALSSNYDLTFTPAALTIGAKTVTVTADAKTKTYGEADPALTYTVTPALITGDTFTGSLNRNPGESVGTYGIQQGTLALSTNYSMQYTAAPLTIVAKELTITADAQSKVYGDVDPAFTYTANGLVGTDVISGTLERATGENVGSYAIQQGSLSAGTNYTLTYTGADFTITPKVLAVQANGKTKVYGEADPALTYSVTGLVGPDALTGSLERTAGENVGTYAISQGTLTAGGNYSLNYTGADLTITPKTLVISADDKTKVYGEADPALTYNLSGLLSGDAVTGSLTRVAGQNVGSYTIEKGSLSAGTNYSITYNSAQLTITPKAVTVTAGNKSKTYGQVDPAFTYTVSPALVNGDALLGALSRVGGEDAGSYAIQQGSLAHPNYVLSFVPGTLTIEKATQQIIWVQTLKAGCDGVTRVVLTATASSGLPVSYTSADESIASITGNEAVLTAAGTVILTATQGGNHNYLPATPVTNTLLAQLPAHLVVKRWDDVLVFDNSSNQYTGWQWYKNGAPIPGATGQYYYESGKLNGMYYAEVKTAGGSTQQTCPVAITPGNTLVPIAIFPNPVTPGQTITVKTGYGTADLQGASILVSNMLGVVVQTVQQVTPETKVTMPLAQGVYVIKLRLANGVTASVNALVKPQ